MLLQRLFERTVVRLQPPQLVFDGSLDTLPVAREEVALLVFLRPRPGRVLLHRLLQALLLRRQLRARGRRRLAQDGVRIAHAVRVRLVQRAALQLRAGGHQVRMLLRQRSLLVFAVLSRRTRTLADMLRERVFVNRTLREQPFPALRQLAALLLQGRRVERFHLLDVSQRVVQQLAHLVRRVFREGVGDGVGQEAALGRQASREALEGRRAVVHAHRLVQRLASDVAAPAAKVVQQRGVQGLLLRIQRGHLRRVPRQSGSLQVQHLRRKKKRQT